MLVRRCTAQLLITIFARALPSLFLEMSNLLQCWRRRTMPRIHDVFQPYLPSPVAAGSTSAILLFFSRYPAVPGISSTCPANFTIHRRRTYPPTNIFPPGLTNCAEFARSSIFYTRATVHLHPVFSSVYSRESRFPFRGKPRFSRVTGLAKFYPLATEM